MHPVRRLRGCLPGGLPAAGAAGADRVSARTCSNTSEQNEQLYRVELDDVAAEELGVITGSAMLKDETRCIRCGLCAERCPVHVITMEAYSIVTDGLPQLIHEQVS